MPRRTPNAIAVLREGRALKQADLARALRTDVPRVSQLEAGFMLPSLGELRALCALLHVRRAGLYGPKALALIDSDERED